GLTLLFDADFADIFEVRGTPRKKRGQRLQDRIEEQALILVYEGLDDVTRHTRISFSIKPETIDKSLFRTNCFLRKNGISRSRSRVSVSSLIPQLSQAQLPGTLLPFF